MIVLFLGLVVIGAIDGLAYAVGPAVGMRESLSLATPRASVWAAAASKGLPL